METTALLEPQKQFQFHLTCVSSTCWTEESVRPHSGFVFKDQLAHVLTAALMTEANEISTPPTPHPFPSPIPRSSTLLLQTQHVSAPPLPPGGHVMDADNSSRSEAAPTSEFED